MEALEPDQRYEETLAYLERERLLWLGLRVRNERTGHGDSQLALHYKASNDRMNMLLDDLYGQIEIREALENVEL